MKLQRKSIKAPLSLLLVTALVISFSFSSLADSAPATAEDVIGADIVFQQATTGTLTAKGPVEVNGIRAKTGATVLNGSVIQAFTGGHASIELGALGRVDLEPRTTITLNVVGNNLEITLNQCGEVWLTVPSGVGSLVKVIRARDVGLWSERREIDVDVKRGQATVKYEVPTQEKIVLAGQHKEFTHATEVTAAGDAFYRVRCHEDHYPVALFLPLGALLIPVFNSDEDPPFLSTLQP